jgi:hypothetical protein
VTAAAEAVPAAGPRSEVVRGRPTAEDLAALTAAVVGLATTTGPPQTTTPPAWSRAARIEGVRSPQPTVTSPSMPAWRWPAMPQ